MFRLAVWLCLATRARGDGLVLVLTSPGYATVGVGEALVFEVVDASGAVAAPVVRVGGEAAAVALRSMRPLADNATAWAPSSRNSRNVHAVALSASGRADRSATAATSPPTRTTGAATAPDASTTSNTNASPTPTVA